MSDKALGKAELFSMERPRPVRVEVPELGSFAYVRRLLAAEVDAFEAETARRRKRGQELNVRGRVVALCMCDAEGRREFADDDANELGRTDGPVVSVIAAEALRVNWPDRAADREAEGN